MTTRPGQVNNPETPSQTPRFIIVTGAAGFIGSRIAEACEKRGLTVIGVDELALFDQRPELSFLRVAQKVDRDDFLSRLENGEWDPAKNLALGTLEGIIHMGACSDTTELNESYLKRVNLEYSQRLWSYAAEHQLPFIYASSAATYGDGSQGYEDNEARISQLKPLNPYGESKRLFDLWALEQEKAGKHPSRWAGFKFFNVYGFGERHKGRMASVVLHAFDQIRSTGEAKLFKSYRSGISDGQQKRDFVAVEDVVDVVLFALDGGLKRGIYNLGTGQARTFLDLALATFKALGAQPNIQFIDMPEVLRGRYQYFTEATMERLRAAGYTRPFRSLEDGVSHYVQRLLKTESTR